MELKKEWRQFKSAKPGPRFTRQYESNQEERKHKWTRPAMIALGALIILVGIVALPAPGPGMLVIAAGAALLARRSYAPSSGARNRTTPPSVPVIRDRPSELAVCPVAIVTKRRVDESRAEWIRRPVV